MKKTLALLLTICLLLQSVPAAAMQTVPEAYPVKEGVQDKQQTDEQQEKGTGILEVKITSALPLSAASQVT